MTLAGGYGDHVARHLDGQVGIVIRAVTQLAIAIIARRPEGAVRFHKQGIINAVGYCHHIARHRNRPVRVGKRAIAQLSRAIVTPDHQRSIGSAQAGRVADRNPLGIRNYHGVAAAVGELHGRKRQCAICLPRQDRPVLEPLIAERRRAGVAHAQTRRLSCTHNQAHGLHHNRQRDALNDVKIGVTNRQLPVPAVHETARVESEIAQRQRAGRRGDLQRVGTGRNIIGRTHAHRIHPDDKVCAASAEIRERAGNVKQVPASAGSARKIANLHIVHRPVVTADRRERQRADPLQAEAGGDECAIGEHDASAAGIDSADAGQPCIAGDGQTAVKDVRPADGVEHGHTHAVADREHRAVVDGGAAGIQPTAIEADDAVCAIRRGQSIHGDRAAVEGQRAGAGRAHHELAGLRSIGDCQLAAVDCDAVAVRPRLGADRQVAADRDRTVVVDGQRVARTFVADSQVAAGVPGRASPGDGDGVIAGDRTVADVAGAVGDHATGGDGETIAAAVAADEEQFGAPPNRTGAGDGGRVVTGADGVADDSPLVEHPPASGDGHRVAGAKVADIQIGAGFPSGAGAGDEDGIVAGRDLRTHDGTIGVDHAGTIGDDQRIAGAAVADPIGGGGPDGTRTGDVDGIIVGTGLAADVEATATVHIAAVGNSQCVTGTASADEDAAAIIPDGVGAGHSDGVVAGAGATADGAVGVQHTAAVGNRQMVVGAVGPYVEIASTIPLRTGPGDGDGVTAGAGIDANGRIGIKHVAAVANRQRTTGTGIANGKIAAIGPDGAGTGDGDSIAGTEMAGRINVAVDVRHFTTVGDGERVAGTVVANGKIAAVAPDGICPGHGHGIITRASDKTDVAGSVKETAAIRDNQRVTGALVASVEVAVVGPNGAGAGDSHSVVAGAGIVADVTVGVEHSATIGDGQTVCGTPLADIEFTAVIPDGTGAGDGDDVVAGGGIKADGADGVEHLAAVSDGQCVAGAGEADGEVAAVGPDATGAGHCNGVVAGGGIKADGASGIVNSGGIADEECIGTAGVTDDEVLLERMRTAVGDEGGATTGIANDEVRAIADGRALGVDRAAVEVDHAIGIGGDERLDQHGAAGDVQRAGAAGAGFVHE